MDTEAVSELAAATAALRATPKIVGVSKYTSQQRRLLAPSLSPSEGMKVDVRSGEGVQGFTARAIRSGNSDPDGLTSTTTMVGKSGTRRLRVMAIPG